MVTGPLGTTEFVSEFSVCPLLAPVAGGPTDAVVFGTPTYGAMYDPSGCYGVDVQIVDQDSEA